MQEQLVGIRLVGSSHMPVVISKSRVECQAAVTCYAKQQILVVGFLLAVTASASTQLKRMAVFVVAASFVSIHLKACVAVGCQLRSSIPIIA